MLSSEEGGTPPLTPAGPDGRAATSNALAGSLIVLLVGALIMVAVARTGPESRDLPLLPPIAAGTGPAACSRSRRLDRAMSARHFPHLRAAVTRVTAPPTSTRLPGNPPRNVTNVAGMRGRTAKHSWSREGATRGTIDVRLI
ncbi:MAG: hypothetical protein KY395_02980, partial [Actinobacteria bacterium]|nr:hypothetical protein [Actinomycetota bacterium]